MNARTRKKHNRRTKQAYTRLRVVPGSKKRELYYRRCRVVDRAAYLPRRAQRGA